MTAAAPTTSTTRKVLALAATEFRLLARNRTVLVTAVVVPLLLGIYLPWSLGDPEEPLTWALSSTFQVGEVIAFVVYYSVVATLVARRNSRVLKRYRTSGLGDAALLGATVTPPVALAVVFVAALALANPLFGVPVPANPLALAVATVGGIALALTTAAATTVFTRNPEQASTTTLPGLMILFAAPVAALIPLAIDQTLVQLALLVPGVGVGYFAAIATGWPTGGVVSLLLASAGVVVWPALFVVLARRRFRWDPRH